MVYDRWIDKENVVDIHNEILFSLKVEGNSAISVDEPTRDYTK